MKGSFPAAPLFIMERRFSVFVEALSIDPSLAQGRSSHLRPETEVTRRGVSGESQVGEVFKLRMLAAS
jgi:hypothetical protein